MRNSHKVLLAAVGFMLMSLQPDFASFIPQAIKLGLSGILLLIGFYLLWKERQW